MLHRSQPLKCHILKVRCLHIYKYVGTSSLRDCLEPEKKFVLIGCLQYAYWMSINIAFNELIWFSSCKNQNTNRKLVINYQEFRYKNCILHLSKHFVKSKQYPPQQS